MSCVLSITMLSLKALGTLRMCYGEGVLREREGEGIVFISSKYSPV